MKMYSLSTRILLNGLLGGALSFAMSPTYAADAVKATEQPASSRPNYILPSATQQGGSGNASEAANKSSAMELLGAGVNVATGAMLLSECPKPCAVCCAMGASAMLQAANLGGASKGSKSAGQYMSNWTPSDWNTKPGDSDTFKFTDKLPTGTDDPTKTTDDKGTITSMKVPSPEAIQKQISGLQAQLNQKGVKIDKDGNITLPDGRKVPADKAGSAEGLAAAGFGGGEISSAMSAANAAADKMKAQIAAIKALAASGVGDGGGGGGGGGRGGHGGDDGGGFKMGKFPWDKTGGKDGKGKGVSGMSKKLGNDRIGVAGDNIFEMVTRRYQARDARNDFLKN